MQSKFNTIQIMNDARKHSDSDKSISNGDFHNTEVLSMLFNKWVQQTQVHLSNLNWLKVALNAFWFITWIYSAAFGSKLMRATPMERRWLNLNHSDDTQPVSPSLQITEIPNERTQHPWEKHGECSDCFLWPWQVGVRLRFIVELVRKTDGQR